MTRAPSLSQLDYSRRPAWLRRPWGRRAVWLTTLCLALGAAARWGPPAWERVRAFDLQSRSMSHSPPPGLVVYAARRGGTPVPVPPPPPYWDKFVRLGAAGPATGAKRGALLLAHRLRPRSGGDGEFTVIVELQPVPHSEIFMLNVSVWRPATLTRGPVLRHAGSTWLGHLITGRDSADDIRFHAGQPDPADRSHFTIPYFRRGQPGTFEGWLMTPNRVRLRVRDGTGVDDWEYQEGVIERGRAYLHW